jgi:hypothetical protein
MKYNQNSKKILEILWKFGIGLRNSLSTVITIVRHVQTLNLIESARIILFFQISHFDQRKINSFFRLQNRTKILKYFEQLVIVTNTSGDPQFLEDKVFLDGCALSDSWGCYSEMI